MASYHCTIKVGIKGKGASASAHAAYILREGKYALKEDVVAIGSMNMPAWAAHDPQIFWQASDNHERERGSTYREFELALPRELTPAQRIALVEDFIGSSLGGRHVVQWAIHCPRAALDGGEQPHAHIMYSERRLDYIKRDPDQFFKRWNAKLPDRGGCQKDGGGTEERLLATRKLWADLQNAYLENHGHDVRVDHRSLVAQGRHDEMPEIHLGREAYLLVDEQRDALREMRAARNELHEARSELDVMYQAARDTERKRKQTAKTQIERDEQERIMCEQREQIAELKRQQQEIQARHHAEHSEHFQRLSPLKIAYEDLKVEEFNDAQIKRDDDRTTSALKDAIKQAKELVKSAEMEMQLLEGQAKAWKAAHPLRAFFGIGIGPLTEMRILAEAELKKFFTAEDAVELAQKRQSENMPPIDARNSRRAEVRMKMTMFELQLRSIGSEVVGNVAEHQKLREITAEIERLQALQYECLERNGGSCDDDGSGGSDTGLALLPEPRRKKRSTLVIEYLPMFVDEKLAKGCAVVESLKTIRVNTLNRLVSGLEFTTNRVESRPNYPFARLKVFNDSVPANKAPEKFWRIEVDLSDVAQDEASILAHIEQELEAMRDECLPRQAPKVKEQKLDDDYPLPTPLGI